MRQRLKRFVRLIGPYPYNPYLIFLFFFALFFSRFVTLIAYLPAGHERWRAGGIIILVSAIPSGIYALGALLLNRYRFWSSNSTVLYVLEVATFQYINFLILPQINNFLQKQIGHSNQTLVTLNVNVFGSSLVLGLIAIALMHQAERKITDRLANANQLVDELRLDRQQLVEADEKLREQTSRFLHDRVQSDLMVIGMKLRSIAGKSSPDINEVIEATIRRLESTRASDLRNLVEVLAPNFEVGGLSGALNVLLEQYRTSMEIILEIDASSEKLATDSLLGIFRIIEQSLLNSLVHGPATRVAIGVKTDAAGKTELIISDDGPGATKDQIVSGVGTAIISSWVEILDGRKAINTSPGHGYLIMIEFPISSPTKQ
jgi:signal transduction histidine kinase